MRILITGASGSGTTTLGRALADRTHWLLLDTDDYYWMPSQPKYLEKRSSTERLSKIMTDLDSASDVIVSGSVMNWGSSLENCFDLVVFLYLEAPIRVERLRIREERELGHADPEFLQWAADYDKGPTEGRSLAKHRNWLATRNCRALNLEGDLSVRERLNAIESVIQERHSSPET